MRSIFFRGQRCRKTERIEHLERLERLEHLLEGRDGRATYHLGTYLPYLGYPLRNTGGRASAASLKNKDVCVRLFRTAE
jgi:hypothetical protein